MSEALPAEFLRFKESLSPVEALAVESWLGMGAEVFREFELYGAVPQAHSPDSMSAIVSTFGSALVKAVPCRQEVFRGLSAGSWRPERMDYLDSLLHGPDTFTLSTYASASASRAIGSGFCWVDEGDDERHASVLLCVRPLTARWLCPFVHKAKDEEEVVLLKGTSYRREAVRKMPDPKVGLRLSEVDVVETTAA